MLTDFEICISVPLKIFGFVLVSHYLRGIIYWN